MYCNSCGQSIPDDSVFCPECGKSARAEAPPPYRPSGGPMASGTIPNYLVQSILVTLFCCLPAGIVGIINASQANSKAAAGDHEGALRAAQKAKQWCWIAVGSGVVVAIAYGLFIIAAGSNGEEF